MINVAIDAMGGDYAPEEIVKGAVLAVQKCAEVTVTLVGRQEEIAPILAKHGKGDVGEHIRVLHAADVIGTGDHPVESVRTKKDSSMMAGMRLVRNGEAQAFISGGNSGALMVGAQAVIGRSKDVSRPPFAHQIPHAGGTSLLLDCGANVDVRPEHLVSFAHLGCDYLEYTCGITNPGVGLVNIGTEENKGNELTAAAYRLLSSEPGITFVGNVEPTGITAGQADILVCDGFTGNVIIKLYEGLGRLFRDVMKDSFSSGFTAKFGALLVKDSLKERMKPFDARNYGGAPILGLKKPVIKVHGNALAEGYCNAVMQCVEYIKAKGEKYGI